MNTTAVERALVAKQEHAAPEVAKPTHAATLVFLRRAHDSSVELAKPLTLDNLSAQHRAALLLYGNIVELVGAFTALCERELWVGAPAVARSALEAHIDFLNVCADTDYVYWLEAHFGVEHLKKLRAARDESNPYFADIACCS